MRYRTNSFWTCPAYQLTVYGDGRVVYEGKAFVAVEGLQTGQISSEKIQELLAAFEEAGFFSMEDSYMFPAHDLPSTITSITINGRSKRISHYGVGGTRELDNAPKALYELENRIDEIVNSSKWTGG